MSCEDHVEEERANLARIRREASDSPGATFRTGDRVVVTSVAQRGVVRGRKDGRVLVYFGTHDNRPVWAWFPWTDVVLDVDIVEVLP